MTKFTLAGFYAEFVKVLVKPHKTPQENFLHGPVGMAKESGEALDHAYRHWNYGKDTDPANVLEEVGDVLFYCQVYLQQIGKNLDDAVEHNVEKLRKRYPDGYSDVAALARADKASGE